MKKIYLLFYYLLTNPKYIFKYITLLFRRKFMPNYIHRTSYGFDMYLNLQNEIDSSIYLEKSFEDNLINFYKHYLSPNSVLLDIGANIGLYSLIGSSIISEGSIYAFEPNKSMSGQLQKSICLNNIENITLIYKAVSNKEGNILFNIADDPAYSSIGRPYNHSIQKKHEIEAITLDIFVQQYDIHRVDFIKIDVEGAEKMVLEGGMQLIESFHPTFSIEVSDDTYASFGYTSKDLIQMLSNLGYNAYRYNGESFNKVPKKHYFHYENLIFIHQTKINQFF